MSLLEFVSAIDGGSFTFGGNYGHGGLGDILRKCADDADQSGKHKDLNEN